MRAQPQKGARLDPACGTCRRRCRRCDRARPSCGQCVSKGVDCEGYPARYQFLPYNTITPSSRRRQRSTAEQAEEQVDTPAESSPQEAATPEISVSFAQDHASPPAPTPGASFPVQTSPLSIVTCSSDVSPASSSVNNWADLNDALASGWVQDMLSYFDKEICTHLVISVDSMSNPFRSLLLPLAHQHFGVLQALLGLALCHSEKGRKHSKYGVMPLALELKLSAIHSLSEMLQREQSPGLSSEEEEAAMAMALLLIFHDITESGISTHGAHLNGVTSFCSRSVENPNAAKSPLKALMLTAFVWLDILRGFSGSDKLAFSNDVRQKILDNREFTFEVFSGCPSVLCRRIGKVLFAGRMYLENDLSLQEFGVLLTQAETFLRAWSPDDEAYPSADNAWRLLANAYRHACLLRVIRFPQPLTSVTPDHPSIVESVEAILDVCAELQKHDVKFQKRMLFPLFMAGAETFSPHLQDYASLRIAAIYSVTGFQRDAMCSILEQVWKERVENTKGWHNVSWTEYTCSTQLHRQHDYLFL